MRYEIRPDRSDWPEWPLKLTLTTNVTGDDAKVYGKKALVTVDVGLHYLHGNGRPYFTVAGDIRIPGRRDIECGGTMHDVFGRYWPELIPIMALHLSDDRGLPMHLEANGLFHLGIGRYSTLNLDHAASHFRISKEDAEALRVSLFSPMSEIERQGHGQACDRHKYLIWLAQQKPRYHQEAEMAIEWLESHGAMEGR